MAVNLVKGQKISLKKEGTNEGLKRIMVGLGWDEVQQRAGGFFGLFAPKPQDIDCDAAVILCGANGKLIGGSPKDYLVYFGNLRHASGAIQHQGDNLTGAGEGDDEQVMVDLPMIPANVDKLVFTVNIYDANVRHQHFGMIRNAFIRVMDISTGKEICRYNLSEEYSGRTGLIVAEIYRHNGEWKFNPIGEGVTEASRLDSLVRLYR